MGSEGALATKTYHGGANGQGFSRKGRSNRKGREANQGEQDSDGLDRNGNCGYCHGPDHTYYECKRRTCHYCRRQGHVAKDCQLKEKHEREYGGKPLGARAHKSKISNNDEEDDTSVA